MLDDENRLEQFASEIDEIGRRVRERLGPEDVIYARRLVKTAGGLVGLGRGLLALGIDPVTFWSGVLFLWLGRQIRVVEIGHSALHGAWDRFPELPALHSERHQWDIGVDEECWRRGHNVEHHMYTNVARRDPDMHIGPVRVTDRTPHEVVQYIQLPAFLFLVFPTLGFWVGMHYSGMMDLYTRLDDFDVIERRSLRTIVQAHWKFLRKAIPYYTRNFVFWPALAGALAPRAAVGALIAEGLGNAYTAATLFCGHIGEDVSTFEAGTKAGSRARWYAMQVIATNNFSVPDPISVLCGALDYQIEHHLFPRLPPNRLREIAPEVRAVCEKYGVEYKVDTWPRTLWKVIRHVAALSRRGARSPLEALRQAIDLGL